jgi:hypothetical protein
MNRPALIYKLYGSRMTIRSAIATIVGCMLLIAAIGATVGYTLGTLAPDYYRSVFHAGREPRFDPVSVGVGQGLTQGTAGGAVLGLAVVALLCWRELRLRPVGEPATADVHPVMSRVTNQRVLLVAGSALALGFCLCAGVVLGLLGGERGAYHRRFLEEQEAIMPLLAGDATFAGVQVHEYSAGGVWLSGEVPTEEDLARLQAGIMRAVGERRASEVMHGIDVRR